jgi:protein-S-isoprenylcysteine O-methyltransferase Ste14
MAVSTVVKLFIFLVGFFGLLYISRVSLRSPGSHGFFRFFVWVCILGLFLLNVGDWFRDPFTPVHLLSWSLLTISALLALHAFALLRRQGKPDPGRADSTLLGVEKTTELVTVGAYRYIRHPLYSSLLLLTWGIFFKAIAWAPAALAVVATFLLIATARADEQESRHYFGAAYGAYMERTKMFIPFLF